MIGPVVLAVAACCLLPVKAPAADSSAKIETAVDQAFRPLLKKYDVPGIAVGVTVNGRRYFFSYGVASKEKNTPVTKDTLFEIGSISKTFTATLFSYAQALGSISPDDHPGKYLPALRGSAIDKASLLNLGTYTAGGLPLQFPDTVANDADAVTYFQNWKPAAAPGMQRRYSNPSIGLFGYLTARAMDGNFADLIETRIFSKLGLRHTYIRIPEEEMDNYAWGYSKTGRPIRVNRGPLDVEAYGVKTTAADMIQFIEANIHPDSLEAPLRQAVEGTHTGYFRTGDMVQGLGWEQYAYPVTLGRLRTGNANSLSREGNVTTQLIPPQTPSKPTLFNKTGSTNGFGAYAAFVPARKIGIVMLANKSVPIPARVTAVHAVLDELAQEER